MITREELTGKNHEEIRQMLETDIVSFKAEVQTIESEQELLDKESELMIKMDEYQEYMKGVEYDLQDECTFDNQLYSRRGISDMIIDFINTQEVQYEYVNGMFELVKLWRTKDLHKISYGAYDSTLRILNMVKFKGYNQWRSILTINEYLSNCHLAYAADAGYAIYLGHLHSAILDQMKTFHPEEMTDQQ